MESEQGEKIELGTETKRDAFLTVQFNALRQEIELQISDRRRVEGQTFIGLAAIYAWIFSNAETMDEFYLSASLLIPVVFSLLGFLRWLGIMYRILALAEYNALIETRVVGDVGGWEAFLRNVRETRPIVGRLEGIAEAAVWAIAIIGTFVVFLWLR